ncbi:phosphatase PAP2 family protein [Tessaracoccus antarcticus]|nr:phosphatase PAP2 family protein [Tessaracoccus antarcticus]
MDARAHIDLPPLPAQRIHRPPAWWWGAPLAALMAGIIGVGILLDGVVEHGDLSLYDPSVTSAFIADRSAGLTTLAGALTLLGSVTVLLPLTVVALAVLALRRRWRQAVLLAAGMSMAVVLTVVVKHLVERPRPGAIDLLGPVDTGFAFPSGHTLNATVFYGIVAGLLVVSLRGFWPRAGVILAWLALVFGVGASRVYLGYHWMTDVLAGWSLGAAVLAAVALMAVVWSRRKTALHEGAIPGAPVQVPDRAVVRVQPRGVQ